MPTLRAAFRTLFSGTHPKYEETPALPADVFAYCAHLLESSGAYHHISPSVKTAHVPERRIIVQSDLRERAIATGKAWRETSTRAGQLPPAPAHVKELWGTLGSHADEDVFVALEPSAEPPRWWITALELLMIADEACLDLGFDPAHPFFRPIFEAQIENDVVSGDRLRRIQRGPISVSTADRAVVCVQPKSRTPTVGCTLRSLSHHLALLPGQGQVRARWASFSVDQQATSKEVDGLGLLLIPFPYRTEAGAFKNLGEHDSGAWGWFEVEQGWLPGSEDKAARAAFVTFVLNLVAKAKSKGRVDGVVLPELSLDYALYGQLARALATDTSIDFIISGLSSDRAGRQGNFVAVAPLFLLGSDRADLGVLDDLFLVREKHHRWKLTKSQLDDYDLGSALDPNRHWWERLDILGRSLDVLVYRGETTLTTLICEDLARVDPCQAVLRAIGPNLVIALLMDGPQLPMRWPGRYATVLADDPGSSVLSLSSMALIKRGNDLGRYPRQSSVGLWKDEQTGVRELQLPRDAHAVHLLLKATRMTERALDGRSDDGQAIRWEWESCVGVAGDADMRPSWIAAGVAPRSAGASAA